MTVLAAILGGVAVLFALADLQDWRRRKNGLSDDPPA